MLLSACNHDGALQPYEKVFKYNGSIQCESSGIELNIMALELIEIGVDIVCSQKGHDGLDRVAVCREGTGNINIYQINSSNLSDARSLGFESVNTLSDYNDQACK